MNRYPAWLNFLVLASMLAAILFALPNVYGTGPAIQLAIRDANLAESQLEQFERVVANAGVAPEAVYLKDGRAVLRFADDNDQAAAFELLRATYADDYSVAQTLAPRMPAWVRALGLEPMSLGLDLRGGIYVLLEVDMDTAINKRLVVYRDEFDDLLRDADIRHRVEVAGDALQIRLTSEEDMETARELIRRADSNVILSDGADARSLRVAMSETQIAERRELAIEQNITTLRNRVNELGVSEPIVQRQGEDRIVVQLPGVQDPSELDRILTATATLEFRLVDEGGEEPGSQRYPGRGGEAAQMLKRRVIASGEQIVDASAGFSQGQPAVSITLDAAGGERMLETTQNNLNKPMSTLFIESSRETVLRDGVEEVRVVTTEEIINTATIRGVFKNQFQITGLSTAEAHDLALLLRAGALAAPVYKIDERTIGPTLGQDNIDRGFAAVAIGFFAVVVFMAMYYKWFGVVANVALFANLVFIVALLSLLQASLTLPGIAGIVLTVGMAVDANVLIFERIREELVNGVSPQTAISAGYEKAFSSIADANITTLIAGVVLFAFGTGPIKGFAVTLSLGIVTSMFTAIVGTRAIVNLWFGRRKLTRVPV